MSQGVEWGLHVCLDLAWSGADRAITATRLAELHDLPPSSLTKVLQHLARAGLVASTSGPTGGFVLARPAADITFLDVVEAIEGRADAFRCTELRSRGPRPAPAPSLRIPCEIASVMAGADAAWRASLAATTVADVADQVAAGHPDVPTGVAVWLRT